MKQASVNVLVSLGLYAPCGKTSCLICDSLNIEDEFGMLVEVM
jgi:hypothetical protein